MISQLRPHVGGMWCLPLCVMMAACSDDDAIDPAAATGGGATADPMEIHVGGVDHASLRLTDAGLSTRAASVEGEVVDAETLPWLLDPLFHGLDITYGNASNTAVAILRLEKVDPAGGSTAENVKYSDYTGPAGERIAEYSFRYRQPDGTEGSSAHWYDNGYHFFQGVYVPKPLRYVAANGQTPEKVYDPAVGSAKSLLTDQSNDAVVDPIGNYRLLERYLGMPADARLHATVGRIKLPFRHRLARVLAYVLIDPEMGADVKIKGFKENEAGATVAQEDPKTSSIRFCNVNVLSAVKEVDNPDGHAVLTPEWIKARKVVPHYVEERGCVDGLGRPVTDDAEDADHFIMYYANDTKTYLFPANTEEWLVAHNKWKAAYAAAAGDTEAKKIATADEKSGYKRTKYGKVPCYDIIARPTYSNESMVMYDEDLGGKTKAEFAKVTNTIDFEITLNNGLRYEKKFVFDLDANYQTVVYLRIEREHIDYDSSGAEIWDEYLSRDGYYGVNNRNGNTLSMAGSSWQRAYRYDSKTLPITDGHWYEKPDDTDDTDDADATSPAGYQQYVTQEQWLEMLAQAHKDGLHHGDYFIVTSDLTIDVSRFPKDFVFTGHLDCQDHVITLTGMGQKVVDKPEWWEYRLAVSDEDYAGQLYVSQGEGYVEYEVPEFYQLVHHDEIPATYYETVEEYNEAHGTSLDLGQFEQLTDEARLKTPAVPAWDEYVLADPQPSVKKALDGEYYVKTGENTYEPYGEELYVKIYHPEEWHRSGSSLFAGLNGIYTGTIGTANIHSETRDGQTIIVPCAGWRAEVLNARLSGAGLFPDDAITPEGIYDPAMVSGYVYNCWRVDADPRQAILSNTPALPKYTNE